MTDQIQEGDQLAKESAPGALGCLQLPPDSLSSGLIWRRRLGLA